MSEQTKQFGKGQRTIPAQKAQKWYPVDDESQPKKVSTPCARKAIILEDGDAFPMNECDNCAGQGTSNFG
ncbi:hypothetical protein ASPWEDRAFT_40622 [Aspergillus wentii DTO 134E9]|uniref:Uncharacterized protein n=1 Tax=Aspergillus wentii DTO 134E9 TaxID=1073089 RepID=A0A1L9RKH6_ASPWE|nr:uncharacterized protein ASPWEDRAFT_40622 [Aspergillus wentii DTO 134E9]OJJ35432.1 hypothetical protein ASPWEDRAFT_40622 [Aspergillus wentii DTO 134E9]